MIKVESFIDGEGVVLAEFRNTAKNVLKARFLFITDAASVEINGIRLFPGQLEWITNEEKAVELLSWMVAADRERRRKLKKKWDSERFPLTKFTNLI